MTPQSLSLDPIKAKARAMWAFGDYDRVSTEVVHGLGPAQVAAAGIGHGDRVLDVAAGSGNASIPAAKAGATVVATDLTPELVQIGAQRSAGSNITWAEADAEHLPYEDDEFDAVLSCVGVMFAPFHQPVADELTRVCRPGGTIALINWTPAGFIGQLFAAMKPFVATPPAGASPGPLWGDEDHVRPLLGERVADLRTERRTLTVDRFGSATQFRDYFGAHYGPTIAAYRNVADDAARTGELDDAILDVAARFGAGAGPMEWEYLLAVARAA
jgi:ubiquinone/menaquinone biosynthesis C-methylase UbiE